MSEKRFHDLNYYMNSFKTVLLLGLFGVVVTILGTIGYYLLENISLFQSFYTTVIVITMTGYNDFHPVTVEGKLLTIILILLGFSIVAYGASLIIKFGVEGHFFGMQRRRKMEKKLEEMKGHFIISGFGRVGHQVASQFEAEKVPYVVVDSKPETAQELENKNIPCVIGNVSSDEVLEKAGVRRAKGLIACADSDTENVYVTISAKDINPEIYVVARASHKEIENKLKKIGADKVISPYYIAGGRMASMVLRPVSVDFLDIVTGSENIELWLKEIEINDRSHLANKTLGEANVRKTSGAMVLSIKKKKGTFDLNPVASSKMEVGDIIVALGTTKQLESLVKMS